MSSNINDIYGCNYVKWTHSVKCLYNDKTSAYDNTDNYLTECHKIYVSHAYDTNYHGTICTDYYLRYLLGKHQYGLGYYLFVYGDSGMAPINATYYTKITYTLNDLGSNSKSLTCSGLSRSEIISGENYMSALFCNTHELPSLISFAKVCTIFCVDISKHTPFREVGQGVTYYYYCYCMKFGYITNCGDPNCNCVAYFNQFVQ